MAADTLESKVCCSEAVTEAANDTDQTSLKAIASAWEEASGEPVACTLNGAELKDRVKTVLEPLWARAKKVTYRDGILSAEYSEKETEELVNYLNFERECCPFFRFRLDFEPGHGPVTISISGPSAAESIIAAMYARMLKVRKES